MTIFTVGKGMFAIGAANKTAKYVVRTIGKKVQGVRGRRPLLDDRFTKAANVRKDVMEALKLGASA